jgi:hypothetical protein
MLTDLSSKGEEAPDLKCGGRNANVGFDKTRLSVVKLS